MRVVVDERDRLPQQSAVARSTRFDMVRGISARRLPDSRIAENGLDADHSPDTIGP